MSGLEKAVTIFVGGLILISVATVLTSGGGTGTKVVLTGLGSATSSSLSAAQGKG